MSENLTENEVEKQKIELDDLEEKSISIRNVKVKVESNGRTTIFDDVVVRVNPAFRRNR